MPSNTTAYYDATALSYEGLHGGEHDPEHIHALEYSWQILNGLAITSVLDVGCGTGRSLKWIFRQQPSIRLFGIDPSDGLLDIAKRSVPEAVIEKGNGENLPFPDSSVDLSIATGIMHHVDRPAAVIAEMFRVSRKAILISDHNNFAFGSSVARRIRMALYLSGFLKFAIYLKQGFNIQGYSEEDGWWYPYSLFNNYADIARRSDRQYLIPTRPPNNDKTGNLLFAQSHFAVLAIKK